MATEAELQLMERPAAAPAARRGGYSTGFGGYAAQVDEAEIIRQFVPVVKRLALRLKGRMPETVQLDDLIQAGLIAVLRLARHGALAPSTDPALQRSIVNAMIDEARREAWAPVRTVRLAKSVSQAMRAVKLRLGRDGTDDEVAAEMRIPLADYHAALVEIAGIRLLDINEFEDHADDRMQEVAERDAAIDKGRVMNALAESIAALPEREKLVLSLYYEQELNMEEVGAVLGLDKSTVCRIHGRALLMLRDVLADWRAEASSSPGSGD
ncbi:MAG TPA: sigma-70 family RNA polymerase sigma factor [Stellaceae bacterium]|jgi:RNA polymerase sigma factor for flagellar operon FliA|nr:sigma-70 family RNA polymerase sigma factor [Stellaceae bacterium]